jgi:hypothetical protein
MERLFQILAVIFIGIAAYFYWQNNTDLVFATGVLGCCSFFIGMRFQLKEKLKKSENEDEENETENLSK